MHPTLLLRFTAAVFCLLLIAHIEAKPAKTKRFAPDIYNLLANYQNSRFFDDTHKRNYFDYADSYYVPSKEWNAYGWNLMNLNTAHPL
uniref:Hemocyanin_N domain-containing protein n=1 Tax=Steinernema glaseri TaxID=37863 RepID=A0A1I8AA54_9BILA